MSRLLARGVRRLGAAAAVLMTVGVAAGVASPAQATPPDACGVVVGHYEVAGSYITGYRYWMCNGGEIPWSVSIERYLSPGVWETVASGDGETTYYCDGGSYNVYRTTGTSPFGILCG